MHKEASLPILLDDFLASLSKFHSELSFHSFDALIYSSLNVINRIFHKNMIIRISLKLGFILNRNSLPIDKELLLKDMTSAEKSLDPTLRGFSRLLNAILDEYEIKADPASLLEPLKKVSEQVYEGLVLTINLLAAYEKIEKMLAVESLNVSIMLLLKGISEAFNKNDEKSSTFVGKWMKWRRHKRELIDLFQDIVEIKDYVSFSNFIKNHPKLIFEASFFFACLPAMNEFLSEKEELNKIFVSSGFASLKDLQEIGLIMDDDSSIVKGMT